MSRKLDISYLNVESTSYDFRKNRLIDPQIYMVGTFICHIRVQQALNHLSSDFVFFFCEIRPKIKKEKVGKGVRRVLTWIRGFFNPPRVRYKKQFGHRFRVIRSITTLLIHINHIQAWTRPGVKIFLVWELLAPMSICGCIISTAVMPSCKVKVVSWIGGIQLLL